MLAYSKERLYPKVTNMITLEVTGGYLYIQKGTYDDALKLSVKQNFESLLNLIDCGEMNAAAIVTAYDTLPEPINFLAPYLGLIVEEVPTDVESLVGALHAITTTISPFNYIKQKKEIRKTLEFSGSVLKEYQEPWKAFKLQCVSEDMVSFGVPFPVYHSAGSDTGRITSKGVAEYTNQEEDFHGNQGVDAPEVSTNLEAGADVEITLDELRADSSWEDCGQGMWFNNKTGVMLSMETDESEEDLEAEFAAMLAEVQGETVEEAPVVQVKSTGAKSQVDILREKLAKK